MLYDISKKTWSEKILSEAGINKNLLPEVKPAGTIIGEISSKMMKELGFKIKAKIVSGAHDQIAAATGAGIIQAGMAVNSAGTVDCITPAFDMPLLNDKMLKYNFCVSPHTVKGLYCTLAYNFTAGSLLKWFRDTFS